MILEAPQSEIEQGVSEVVKVLNMIRRSSKAENGDGSS